MSTELSSQSVFPQAYGNEVESGLQIGTAGHMDEPYDLAAHLSVFLPNQSVLFESGGRVFTSNGGQIYADSISLATNIELATAECSSPTELTTHINGMRALLELTVKNYLNSVTTVFPDKYFARLQRRVVDSRGLRKGCHDNFAIPQDTPDYYGPDNLNSFISHLATRSLVTGAGYMKKDGFAYAQKVDGISSLEGHGYGGQMYRIADSYHYGRRFEVRCSDVNVSDWATWIRIGSTALVIALQQTPIAADLNEHAFVPHRTDAFDQIKSINATELDKDGHLKATPEQMRAIDFQQKIAEFAMDKLPDYIGELPAEYWRVATELYKFCQDYKAVTGDKKAPLELLADRADWAAKLSVIRSGIEKDRSFGIDRRFGDIESMAHDLRFDIIGYSALDGVVSAPTVGYGHKWRNRGKFMKTVDEAGVGLARFAAPTTTRANIRTEILRNFDVEYCDWDSVDVQIDDDSVTINLFDVTDPELPLEARADLTRRTQTYPGSSYKPES